MAKKTIKQLKKKLWEECKRIIRKRYENWDGTWDCYTCGNRLDMPVKAHTGHFIPSSVCSTAMRYDLDNLKVQCYSCNIHKSGNWPSFERHLIADGIDVEALKQRNEDTKGLSYREDWYVDKIEEYKQL